MVLVATYRDQEPCRGRWWSLGGEHPLSGGSGHIFLCDLRQEEKIGGVRGVVRYVTLLWAGSTLHIFGGWIGTGIVSPSQQLRRVIILSFSIRVEMRHV